MQIANLLIGSSNVNRFYRSSDFPDVRQYKMENLDSESKTVLINVVENFVVDAVVADIVELEGAINKCINAIFQSSSMRPSSRLR